MDRQESTRTARKVRGLMEKGKYARVISLAQGINYGKVDSSMLILDIASAYEELNQREEAKNVLLEHVTGHSTNSRNIMQKLINLCLETGDIQNGIQMCIKFSEMWPDDPTSLLMRYQITAAAGGSLSEQAVYLEEYKKANFDEEWGYELAELYYRDGRKNLCAAVCHDLILYFGEGEYVEQAAKIKNEICGLTQEEILVLSKAYPQKNREELPSQEEVAAPAQSYDYGDEDEEDYDQAAAEAAYYADLQAAQQASTQYAQQQYAQQQYAQQQRAQQQYAQQQRAQQQYAQQQYTQQQYENGFYAQSDEELMQMKAQYSVDDKLRQTEERARAIKERSLLESQNRQDMINRALHSDYYEDVEKHRVLSSMGRKQEPVIFTGKDKEASINKILSRFHRALMEEGDEEDDIYITVGLNSKHYVEEIETRMRDELTMLSEEQIRELKPAQVKEIYELVVLKDVKSQIAALIKASLKDIPETDTAKFAEDLNIFVQAEPYHNLADELNELEQAKRESEARAEARARAEAIARAEENARRIAQQRAEAAIQAQQQALAEETAVEQPTDEGGYAEEIPVENLDVPEAELTEAAEPEWAEAAAGVAETTDETAPAPQTEEVTYTMENDIPAETLVGDSTAPAKDVTVKLSDAVKERNVLDEIHDANADLPSEIFLDCILALAEEQGYYVDDNAFMTIAVLSEQMRDQGIANSLNHAKAMTDAAIAKCSKRSLTDKLFDRYNKKNSTKLKDRHFDWNPSMMEN